LIFKHICFGTLQTPGGVMNDAKMLKEKASSAEVMDGLRNQAGEVNLNR
jgi:hypothetical protein